MSFTIEQLYKLFQGALVFQCIYMAILFGFTKRKDALIYSIYLLLQAIYFFGNAPYTFFNINDDIVFDSPIYIYLNTPLVIITNLAYVYFLKTFFSSIYKNLQLDKLVLLITIISPCMMVASAISIYLLRSNQYIFYTVNLISTLFSIYLLVDIRRRKITNVRWIIIGIVFNILGNMATVTMIILGQYGVHTMFTVGYPLLFMRCGILFDMAFYQIAIIKKWSNQEKQLAIQQLETQLTVEKVRNEISKELHDDIGSTLSGINMYSHMAKQQQLTGQEKESQNSIHIIQQASDEMIHQLKDIVWVMQPGHDTLDDLLNKIKEFAEFITGAKTITQLTDFTKVSPGIKISTEARHHIYTIAKEILNNAVKYSNAPDIIITATTSNNYFILQIKDNGRGFDSSRAADGNGLKNVRSRALEMGGKLELQSTLEKGTIMTLTLKITQQGIV